MGKTAGSFCSAVFLSISLGQEREKERGSSPNRGCIRTGEGVREENKSEWRSYSDREGVREENESE